MREITLTTKTLKTLFLLVVLVLLTIAVVLYGGTLVSWGLGLFHPAPATPTPDPAAQAARMGAAAFFTLPADEDVDGWADRLCGVVEDKQVCDLYQTVFADFIRQFREAYPGFSNTATAQEAVLVDDQGEDRVYRVSMNFTAAWPQVGAHPTVYVHVHRGPNGWRFVRVLFDEEAARYVTPTPTSTRTP